MNVTSHNPAETTAIVTRISTLSVGVSARVGVVSGDSSRSASSPSLGLGGWMASKPSAAIQLGRHARFAAHTSKEMGGRLRRRIEVIQH